MANLRLTALVLLFVSTSSYAELDSAQLTAQNALKKSADELGLNAAERKIFETEVLPAPFSFVSNYSSTSAQVDKDKLRNYIHFTAPSGQTGAICLGVHASSRCPTCQTLKPTLAKTFGARLERRGYNVKPAVKGSDETSSSFDDFLSKASDPSCTSYAFVTVVQEHSADADEEGDDIKIRTEAFLALSADGKSRTKSHGQAVAVIDKNPDEDKDATLRVLTKLLSSQNSDLFVQAVAQNSGSSLKAGADEKYLRLEGVKSFGDYSKFKQSILNASANLRLEERVISPGVFQFAVSGIPMRDLAKIVQDQAGVLNAKILGSGPDEIAVVLK